MMGGERWCNVAASVVVLYDGASGWRMERAGSLPLTRLVPMPPHQQSPILRQREDETVIPAERDGRHGGRMPTVVTVACAPLRCGIPEDVAQEWI